MFELVFPLQLDPTRDDMGTMEGQSLAQHQFKTMFSSHGILRGVCQFARTHNEWNLCYCENAPEEFNRFIQQGVLPCPARKSAEVLR